MVALRREKIMQHNIGETKSKASPKDELGDEAVWPALRL